MSVDNSTQPNLPSQDEPKPSTGGGGGGSDGRKTSSLKPPEKNVNCPRCDSPNTKFCYYNNYNHNQPRYYCKTCRRYWTKGGALRNVPIGGGCRKKKSRSSSSRFNNGESSISKALSNLDIGVLSLLTGTHSPPPAVDFQLGALNHLCFSSSSSSSSLINTPPAYMNLDSLMFNFPVIKQDHGGLASFQEIGVNSNINLASSMHSLSSINQNLHLRLQQQRLPALSGEFDQQNLQIAIDSPSQKLQPVLFQNLEIPKPSMPPSMVGDLRKEGGGLEAEWLIAEGGFEPVNTDRAMVIGPTPTPTPTDGNMASGNYEYGSFNNWNSGIHEWNQFNQYNVLP